MTPFGKVIVAATVVAFAVTLACVPSKAEDEIKPQECTHQRLCLPASRDCNTGNGQCCKLQEICGPGVKELVHWVHYREGCIAWFLHSTYFSPDCKNPGGGGQTVLAWKGEYKHVQAFAIFKDCVITAFSGGGIYKSCDGLNLGGGGNTVRVYQSPTKVKEMTVGEIKGRQYLKTKFEHGPWYCDPTGDHPGGGGQTEHC